MKYKFLVLIGFVLPLLFILFKYQASRSIHGYQCPPCGCSADGTLHQKPGKCHACPMRMRPINANRVKLHQAMKPFFVDNHEHLYSKFIYPSFIVGFIFGLLALFKRKRKLNPFLGGIILVLALYGFKNQLYGVQYGLTDNFRLMFVPLSFITLLGPLSYLYLKSQSETIQWKWLDVVHVVPSLVFLLLNVTFLGSSDEVKSLFMFSAFETSYNHLEQLFVLLVGLGYLYAAIPLVQKIRTECRNTFKARWVHRFYLGFTTLLLLWLAVMGLNYAVYDMGVTTLTYNPLWVGMSLFIYWVLIEVLMSPKEFFNYSARPSTNGYSIDNLAAEKVRLEELMVSQKPFKDPLLSLDELALMMSVNPKYLSLLINQGFGKNFYEFLSDYRIAEVKTLLVDPSLKHLTIAAIANEAGFKSKSSFNSLFKKTTQLTPREYLKSEKGISS